MLNTWYSYKNWTKTINIQHKISPDQNGDDLEDNNTTKKFLTVCKQCILLLTWQFQVKCQKWFTMCHCLCFPVLSDWPIKLSHSNQSHYTKIKKPIIKKNPYFSRLRPFLFKYFEFLSAPFDICICFELALHNSGFGLRIIKRTLQKTRKLSF